MNLKTAALLLGLLSVFTVNGYSQPYQIPLSHSASYQLQPGDLLQVNVTAGDSDAQVQQTILKKVRLLAIAESKSNVVKLNFNLSKRQIRAMNAALAQPQSRISLRIVQKQPRAKVASVADDGVPDLDLEYTTELAQQPSN